MVTKLNPDSVDVTFTLDSKTVTANIKPAIFTTFDRCEFESSSCRGVPDTDTTVITFVSELRQVGGSLLK